MIHGYLLSILLAVAASSMARAEERSTILAVFYSGCEHLCNGFQDRIAESGFAADVVVRDVAQDKSQLPEVVAEARAMEADLVLTWGTNVTLGIIGTLDDAGDPAFLHEIPVVFTVVADPFGVRIAESFDGSGRPNVAGTFNRVPESVIIEVIRRYDDGFDKLGLLYNSNEANSVIKKDELEALARELGFELHALEIDPETDGPPDPANIPVRMAELRDLGVRWMYLGSSSYLRSQGELYTRSAVDNGIAIVSPYETLVREQQALLSIAAHYYDIGTLAADLALQVLREGAVPGELPIAHATDYAYVVNMDVARKLDLIPPFAFLQVAEVVGQ